MTMYGVVGPVYRYQRSGVAVVGSTRGDGGHSGFAQITRPRSHVGALIGDKKDRWDEERLGLLEMCVGRAACSSLLAVVLSLSSPVIGIAEAKFGSLTSEGQSTAAEFQTILAARGTALPSLTSSPNEKKKNVVNPSSSKELIQELRRENKEIERLRAELENASNKDRGSNSTGPAETGNSQVGVEDSPGGIVSALNVLGILAASVLGGYVTLQKKDAEQKESEFEGKLASEKAVVSTLQDELAVIQNMVAEGQALATKLKWEASVAAAEASRQLSLEQAAREAVEQERRLTERSLIAEQRLADAMRREAENTKELLEAEKAAKFAADAEARELNAQLEQIRAALEKEKKQARQWMEETERANKRLSDAQITNNDLLNANKDLNEDLEERQARIEELTAAAQALEVQLSSASEASEQQSRLIERLGKENLSMKEAMNLMKTQAAERALIAQKNAEEAEKQRVEAELEAANLQASLTKEHEKMEILERQIQEAKDEISRSQNESRLLKERLTDTQEKVAMLEEDLASLAAKAAAAEKALEQEKQIASDTRAENMTIRSDLASLQSEISQLSSSMAREKAEKEQLLEAIETLKTEYGSMSERVEAEQNTVASLRKESAELRKMIGDLQTKNKTLGTNIIQLEDQYKQKLATIQQQLEAAENAAAREGTEKEDAVAAIDKLENVIQMLQDDMQESQEMALGARSALESERAARLQAESSAQALRDELEQIAAAEENARVEVQFQLAELRSEYEAAMEKLTELQNAKPKRTRRTTKKTEEGAEENPAPKKRGRPRKTKAQKEEENPKDWARTESAEENAIQSSDETAQAEKAKTVQEQQVTGKSES